MHLKGLKSVLKARADFISNPDEVFFNLVRIKSHLLNLKVAGMAGISGGSIIAKMSEGFTLSETLTEICSTHPPEGLGKAKNPILRTRQNGAITTNNYL